MFQTKNFVSIVAAEINVARSITDKITDFQPGSVARTLMEAPAAEMEELYLQMLHGLLEAIPEATYRSFNFDRLQPARAFGFVSISMSPAPVESIAIPYATAFTTSDGRTYTSTEALICRPIDGACTSMTSRSISCTELVVQRGLTAASSKREISTKLATRPDMRRSARRVEPSACC